MEPLITIIIPVYNAEQNLSKSLDSIKNLEYKNLQVIFINDASTDGSLLMLENFVNVADFVCEIISHRTNLGVAAARNTGLNNAVGDYIYFLDADDSLHPEAIKIMVEKATEGDYDIVGCNWFLSFQKNNRKMKQYNFQDSWHAVEGMLEGKMRWNLWLFMIKRSLFENNNIRFIPNKDMGEDLLVMSKLFTYANRVTYIDEPLYYYYQLNSDSLTKVYNQNHIEQVSYNVNELEHFLMNSKFASLIKDKISILKLIIKFPLLISNRTLNYKKWNEWFQETNDLAMDKHYFNFRMRLLHWSAIHKHFWLIQLYYFLVIKFVYGVLYR